MDDHQRRIIEDLSGLFSGEVRCDELAVAMYATDASLFEVKPLGVAYPRHRDDVVTLARYAGEMKLPLIPRGAGSNVSGGALGAGLIVDFSRHMHAIEHVGEKTVTVQAGVVHERLNQELRKIGRYFAPDPSSTSTTTIGGMLGVDAAGSRAVRVGSTRDHVVSIDLVLAGGQALECGIESSFVPGDLEDTTNSHADQAPEVFKKSLIAQLHRLLAANHDLILRQQPPLFRNSSGYYLRGILANRHVNLPRMLVGSEGTLGLFTSAKLHTSPLPEFRGVVLLLFGQMDQAIESVPLVMPQQPSACDLLDRRLLSLGRENDSRFESIIPVTAEAALLIEQTGFSRQQTQDRIAMAIAAVQERFRDVIIALEAYDFDDVEFLWELPRKVVPMLARMKGDIRPLPFIEDVAIPPEALKDFYAQAQRALQRNEVTASLYSHAASGQIHMRPFLPFPRHVDPTRMAAISRDIFDIAISVGGTISGEHGDGLARSGFVEQQYGALYPIFQQIKALFDPMGLMNPGKIVRQVQTDEPQTHATVTTNSGATRHPSDAPVAGELTIPTGFTFPATHLRPTTKTNSNLVQLQLHWDATQVASAVEACNGCGLCRTQKEELRMCPFFRVHLNEEASPRAKANVMRAWLNDALPRTAPSSEEMERLASLCFNCKQCDLECPTNTPISHLMTEMKAQVVEANGLSRSNWFLARAHELGALACRFSWLINPLLKNRAMRWLMETLLGIHRERGLPEFARRSFLSSHGREERDVGGKAERTVVYFVDHFANFHDPELARAFVSIMQKHGIRVQVPSGQSSSGMAMVSAGDVTAARRIAEANIRELAEFARDGVPIVCTEPSAALCLREEYPALLDHPDTQLVADRVIEAGAYLMQLQASGQLQTDFTELPIRVGYHTPCHLKALKSGSPLQELLHLIPGLDLVPLENGCSGMAGAFGLATENFELSLAIGRDLLERMRHPDFVIGSTECSSCKLQMEHRANVPTIHPLKLLAAAYGLLPRVKQQVLERT